ncbi:MAG: Flp pilus assembly protein CpaB [Hyphomicrobiales bacterium]|nr:MAG: Flp pilus assembly protein CpaB [Hyphomicrobiales bacterium]
MSGKLILMGGLAIAFGATSYYAGNEYLDTQTQARLSAIESNRSSEPQMEMKTIVVASTQMKFGESVEASMLKEVPWPAAHRPKGSFSSTKELTGDDVRRILTTIQPGEPVLASKLSGKGSRGGLAGIIAEGMRAVTIPVNMVDGVGGFIQPGDRVDIIFTRENRKTETPSASIIMANVKVLTVDQKANQRSETAKVAKSVTLETDINGAQRLALARTMGSLSLLLRSTGDAQSSMTSEITGTDLNGKPTVKSEEPATGGLLSFLQDDKKKKTKTITVINKLDAEETQVRIEEPKKDASN